MKNTTSLVLHGEWLSHSSVTRLMPSSRPCTWEATRRAPPWPPPAPRRPCQGPASLWILLGLRRHRHDRVLRPDQHQRTAHLVRPAGHSLYTQHPELWWYWWLYGIHPPTGLHLHPALWTRG